MKRLKLNKKPSSYVTGTPSAIYKIRWSRPENVLLHAAVAIYATYGKTIPSSEIININTIDWFQIVQHFPGKTEAECKAQWHKIRNGLSLRREEGGIGYFDPLKETVATNSNANFTQKRKKAPWTATEKQEIERLQQELGNKWTMISKSLGNGRSANDVKNYWHTNKDEITRRRLMEERDRPTEN